MTGYKLTSEQSAEIAGKFLNDTTTFNPVQDINGDWFIFEGEVSECTNPEFYWVKDLEPSEYIAPIISNDNI